MIYSSSDKLISSSAIIFLISRFNNRSRIQQFLLTLLFKWIIGFFQGKFKPFAKNIVVV